MPDDTQLTPVTRASKPYREAVCSGEGDSALETVTFRPKRDRRTQPRIAPTDITDGVFERRRRVEEAEAGHKPDETDAEQERN